MEVGTAIGTALAAWPPTGTTASSEATRATAAIHAVLLKRVFENARKLAGFNMVPFRKRVRIFEL
jgi:hypothetical protein